MTKTATPLIQGDKTFSITPEELNRTELWAAMGYKNAEPEGEIRKTVEALVDKLVPTARIRYTWRILEAEKISPRQIVAGGVTFSPEGIICSYLKGMTHVCMYIATAGREFDRAVKELNAEGDVFKDFIADSIGTTLAELAVSRLGADLEALVDGTDNEELLKDGLQKSGVSMSYSPGYCDWNLREQRLFFSLFPEEPCGVTLTESCLMQPEKSVSGFFALGKELKRQPYHCDICRNKNCFRRRIR